MANPTAEEAILTKLAQAPSFHPAGAKLFVPDWTLDPGDVVTVTAKDNVNDPDETPTSYNVPIYSLNLTWNGASRVEIESTGNQQREPLSALRRKEYQTGRRGYGATKALEEEVDEQYQHWTTENNVYRESVYKIMGVELNEDGTVKYIQATDEQGNPIYDEQGNPVWELDEAGNPKPVYNPDSDGSISGKVRTTAQDLESLYTVTGVASLPSGETTLYSYTSKIKQTADSVSSEVTAARGGETSLSSKISQLSGQIGLVIEKKDGNDVISRSAIIAAINEDSTSTATISADQIDLEGYVTADELYVDGELSAAKTIYAGNIHVYEDAQIDGDITTSADSELTLGIIECTSLTATDSMYIGDTEITEDIFDSFLTSGIVSASVANNILTLTDSDGNTVNFSKATSVNGEWGSNQQGQPTGVFTVTATQTNRNTTTGEDEPATVGTVFTSITQAGHWGNTNNQEDPNTYYQSTNATIGTSQQLHTVKTAEINAAGRFYAGKNSVGLAPMSYTELQGENYPSSQTIYTDTTGRTDTSGNADNLHRDITLSLDADGSYVYMKHGSDIIARINNPGGGTITVDSWNLTHQTGTDYTYKASVNVNGTSYESGNLNAAEAYNNGWTGAYQSVGIFPTAVADLIPGGSPITIYAQAKATSGSAKSNVASVQVKARALNLKNETFTTNDTYPVPDGYDGYGTVTVNVHDGGGGGDYYATFVEKIELDGADVGTNITKYSTAHYSDSHKDPAAKTIVTIDTSNVYNAGVTYGQGGNPINVNKGTWNLYVGPPFGMRCIFSPSAGAGTSEDAIIYASATAKGLSTNSTQAEFKITDHRQTIFSQYAYLKHANDYAYIVSENTTPTDRNVLARLYVGGGGSGGDTRTVDSISPITLSPADIGPDVTKYPNIYYSDETNDNSIPVSIDSTAVYRKGQEDGAGLSIEQVHKETISDNNATILVQPTYSKGYDVMASAQIKVEVPPVYRIAQNLTQTITLQSSHHATEIISNNEVSYDIGPTSNNFSVTIDASNVWNAGVAEGARSVGYTPVDVWEPGTENKFSQINVPTGTTTVNAVSGSGALYQVNSNGSLYLSGTTIARAYQGYLYYNDGSGFQRVPNTGNGSWFYVDGNVSQVLRSSSLKVALASTTQYTVATGTRSAYITSINGTISFWTAPHKVSNKYYIRST